AGTRNTPDDFFRQEGGARYHGQSARSRLKGGAKYVFCPALDLPQTKTLKRFGSCGPPSAPALPP
ncbi:MAG: hypothetical protein LBK05_09520, partial [Treponema sp.]|nr:hypothetical protein [Treponema sp.]